MIFNLNNDQTYGPYKDDGYMKLSRMLEKKLEDVRSSHILISYKGAKCGSIYRELKMRQKKRQKGY